MVWKVVQLPRFDHRPAQSHSAIIGQFGQGSRFAKREPAGYRFVKETALSLASDKSFRARCRRFSRKPDKVAARSGLYRKVDGKRKVLIFIWRSFIVIHDEPWAIAANSITAPTLFSGAWRDLFWPISLI